MSWPLLTALKDRGTDDLRLSVPGLAVASTRSLKLRCS